MDMRAEKISRFRPLLWSLRWLSIILLVFFLLVSNVFAQQPTPTAVSQGMGITDDQVNAIARQLYCPVCENIPLDVCPTQACAQWRELVREKLAAGWNEKQIKDYFVEQYGERVLGVPPARGINWLVYLVPPIGIVSGVYILYKAFRSWKSSSTRTTAALPPEGDLTPRDSKSPEDEVEVQPDDYVRRLEEELRKRESL